MKRILAYLVFLFYVQVSFGQTGTWNPFVNAIDLTPDNSTGLALGTYACGDPLTVSFNIGQSTNARFMPGTPTMAGTLDNANRLEVDICIVGYVFDATFSVGDDASGVISGTYESFFTWQYISTTCIRGTQSQVIPKNNIVTGAGSGSIILDLKVPIINTCTTCLNVNATLGIPAYISESGPQMNDNIVTTNSSVWCRLLPIQKLEIGSLSNENNVNKLTWKTFNEHNTLEFEVERKYSNEGEWMTIGKTPAAGQSSIELTYAYNDLTYANRDKIYYRIKQIDVNGQSNYTDIKSIDLKRNSSVKLDGYPNPVKDLYHLTITGAKDDKVSIDVFDILGRSVSRKTLSIVKGSNYHDLNMGSYTPGTYIVRVSSAEINESMTVVKVD